MRSLTMIASTIASTIALIGAATFGVVAFTQDTAHACGGCFVPPDEQTAVDSHRMVISLGMEETVLWDQIAYTGNPADFVWVLPVPSPDVTVEIADNEFFDELDRQTAPSIQPLTLPPFCGSSNSSGCVFMGADDALAAPEAPSDGVTVFDRGVVGPYETLTIGSEDPTALYTWLDANGYGVTADSVPAMEHYIGLGNAFVVLRLQPGVGVSAMQPVRVRYPGFMGTFPLKMVVVGAQGVLDLSLWVFAEQRYDASNYGTLEIDQDQLSWDWNTNRSNYAELFDSTVEQGGNRAWIAEFADEANMLWLPSGEDLDIIHAHNTFPYVTRLRTRMLVDHIDDDMILAPAAVNNTVSNFLSAPNDLNFPENPCGASNDDGIYCTLGNGNAKDAAFLGLVMALGIALVFRRRRHAQA